MITLLVDDIIEETGEGFPRFITPSSNAVVNYSGEVSDGWNECNQRLLRLYNLHDSFSVIPFKDYKNQSNPHYLINMTDWYYFINPDIWENIPKNNLDILLKHKIPILLWYPLEGPDNSNLGVWHNMIDMKNKVGLIKNRVLVLSTTDLKKYYFKKKSVPKTWTNQLNEICFIPSVNYAVDNGISYKSDYVLHNDFSKKNKDFLCLNNTIDSRINRLMLLQSLYITEDLYKKNIISSIWKTGFEENMPLAYDNGLKKQFFIKEFKKIIFFHDKKIITDPDFKKLIKVLKNTCDFDLKDALLNLEPLVNSKLVKFLCHLAIKTISGPKSVFPKKMLSEDYSLAVFDIKNQNNDNDSLYRILPWWPRPHTGPEMHMCYSHRWYTTSWFSIITESWELRPEQGSDVVHIYFPMMTEKTIKTIVNNHPFVVFSAPGSTRLLNKLGFKTFDQSLLGLPENFDEEVLSLTERTYIFIKALKKFSEKSHKEKIEIWKSIKPDVIYNSDRLRKTDWIQFQHDLILKHGQHGKIKN